MKISKEELIAKHEHGTYLDGLYDAQDMTKKEIANAIEIVVNN